MTLAEDLDQSKVLFYDEKHGKCGYLVSRKKRRWFIKTMMVKEYAEIDSTIIMTENEIIIRPRKGKEITLEIQKVASLEKASGEFDIGEYNPAKTIWVYMNDGTEYKIFFTRSRHDGIMNQSFFNAIHKLWERINQERARKKLERKQRIKEVKIENFRKKLPRFLIPYKELSYEKLAEGFGLDETTIEQELRKLISDKIIVARMTPTSVIMENQESTTSTQIQQTVVINAPSRSELKAFNCPQCKAPLSRPPPCKCDFCGVLVQDPNAELRKLVSVEDGIASPGIIGEIYGDLKEISSKLDEIDEK